MTDLWEDLDGLSRKPGPTMTITKGQFGALLNEIATLRAALDGLTAEDLWLGVEISAIGILTFAEPMVSVAGARAAIRAHLATMNEAGNG
jgi:hypothetical protein